MSKIVFLEWLDFSQLSVSITIQNEQNPHLYISKQS